MRVSFPHNRTVQSVFLLLTSSLLLSACGSLPHDRYGFAQDSAPTKDVDHTRVADAVPKVEPRSKYGNPKSYVVQGKRYTVRQSARGFVQTGDASWYGTKFHGHRTSSGEPYDMYAMTAAHKTIPIPSYVEVHNLDNQRKIIVRVNDRGPFISGRIIDLSYVAAKKLGITTKGTGRVKIRVIDPAASAKTSQANTTPVTLSRPATPQPAVTVAANNPGQLYLQVGAFTNRDNASQLLNRLVSATQQNISINRKATNNYNVYRVRIGPLQSEADALKLRSQLSPLGIDSPHIVVE
ncbi:MAG: septal ring lytic transglycosylase RlpA family protein [Gammaproteobacteria bacterium]|nr:septal ring lytic transglycosylase RlpA family protein [Gammaproteobacteria bacterium]MCF6259197.1 septal ring lytic transglycosylase RlpA family protein [Gammaproteobacteria bacterium]